jgi:HSP20 family molecular chaperone IbpA
MSRVALLDGSLWLGLSEQGIGGSVKAGEAGYSPYNIELLPEGARRPESVRLTLAVAGFGLDELEVSVEAGQLTIRGSKRKEGAKDYLHRGIAARQFRRSFALAKGVEIRRAELHNGLLAIELERPHKDCALNRGVSSASRQRLLRRTRRR